MNATIDSVRDKYVLRDQIVPRVLPYNFVQFLVVFRIAGIVSIFPPSRI